MRLTLLLIVLLTVTAWQVRAASHGVAFSAKDDGHGELLLTPLRPATIRAVLIAGPRQISKGEILICQQGTDVQKVTQNGQEGTVTQFKLTCGDRVFILTTIGFEEQ